MKKIPLVEDIKSSKKSIKFLENYKVPNAEDKMSEAEVVKTLENVNIHQVMDIIGAISENDLSKKSPKEILDWMENSPDYYPDEGEEMLDIVKATMNLHEDNGFFDIEYTAGLKENKRPVSDYKDSIILHDGGGNIAFLIKYQIEFDTSQ
jgi:Asp-tRNA(Asn)/Glu-tRNA(Gln) amidotransferase B subunit